MKKSIFTKIIYGEVFSYKIFENSLYMAILDIRPLTIGHTIIFPKNQISNFFDIDKTTYIEIMVFVRTMSFCLKNVLQHKKIGIIISGFEIYNHAHIHLIPANQEKELNFFNKRIHLSHKELLLLSNKLNFFLQNIIK